MIDVKIQVEIESHITETVMKMADSLFKFNTVQELARPGFTDSPETRIIRYGLGRQTGHTEAAIEIYRRLHNEGKHVILVAPTYEMQHYLQTRLSEKFGRCMKEKDAVRVIGNNSLTRMLGIDESYVIYDACCREHDKMESLFCRYAGRKSYLITLQ